MNGVHDIQHMAGNPANRSRKRRKRGQIIERFRIILPYCPSLESCATTHAAPGRVNNQTENALVACNRENGAKNAGFLVQGKAKAHGAI